MIAQEKITGWGLMFYWSLNHGQAAGGIIGALNVNIVSTLDLR
jgi:hypothetical protein